MKNILIGIGFLLGLVGFFFVIQTNQGEDVLARYGLDGLTVSEMVEKLENQTNELSSLKASIDGTNLNLVINGETIAYSLPKDLFYLSFAPYINTSHRCGTHNLISCRGELVNTTFQVIVTDKDGNEILNQEVNSYENGFAGIWLPSNMEGSIRVSYNGLSSEALISTFAIDYTCLTTLLLS